MIKKVNKHEVSESRRERDHLLIKSNTKGEMSKRVWKMVY